MICQRCGEEWDDKHGTKLRCPSCKLTHISQNRFNRRSGDGAIRMIPLSKVEVDDEDNRLISGPWDHCFGGGIIKQSLTLLGGTEGGGKSTLALQICDAINEAYNGMSYYIATEGEAMQAIASRAQRIQLKDLDSIKITDSAPEDVYEVLNLLNEAEPFPTIVVIDSLPGLMGQDLQGAVDFCKMLKGWVNDVGCPIILIDHLNKEDDFAGLRALQYYVDLTMTLKKDPANDALRHLRVFKSRCGPTDNVSVPFFMTEKHGLIPHEDT